MRLTTLSDEFLKDLLLRFDPGELVDFLDVPFELVVDLFEYEIGMNMDRLLEELYGTSAEQRSKDD